VDQATRDRWVVETADQTLDRIEAMETGEGEAGEQARDAYPEANMSEYSQEVKVALAQVARDESKGEGEGE
jgi:RPA family protein